MSEPLFTKYRPSTFDEVVGQDDAVALLKAQLETDSVRQAYLISGPHGTGKTTLARLLAKELGATEFDVFEADAGSNRGIEDVRRLQEIAMLMPLGGRRVFILDEAHQFTDAAANALLKTLEEPPSSAIFVLCTTDPQKVKATVRSRCQQIMLKRPSTKAAVELLSRITALENIDKNVDPGALGAIAEASNGSLRDAVSLLDQLNSSGRVTTDRIAEFVSSVEGYFEVVRKLAALDAAGTLELFEKGLADGARPDTYLNGLLDHLRQLLTCRVGGRIYGPLAPKIQAQAKQVDPDIIREFARALIPATEIERRVDLRLLLTLAVIDTVERFHGARA